MKRYRTVLLLFIILVGLGGIATWDEWKTDKEEELKKTENKLVTIDTNKVTRIEYRSRGVDGAETGIAPGSPPIPGHEPVNLTLEKIDGVWRVVSPVGVLADAEAIASFIKTLDEYKFDRVVAEDRTQDKGYGLVEPNRVIKLESPEGQVTIHVGNKSAVDYHAYVRIEGQDRVLIGSQYILVATQKSLFDFRDKHVVKLAEGELVELTIKPTIGALVQLSRVNVDSPWQMVKPEAMETDANQVRSLLGDLTRLKATEFVDRPGAEFDQAMSKPNARILWKTSQGSVGQLVLSDVKGKLYARVGEEKGSVIVGLPDEQRKKLVRTWVELRNRRIFNFPGEKVAAVEIDGSQFSKVKGDFYAESDRAAAEGSPGDVKVTPKYHVRSLVVDLEFGNADDFLTLSSAEARSLTGAPQHRIELSFESGVKPETVTIDLWPVKGDSEKFWLRYSSGKFLYRVSKNLISNIKEGEPKVSTSPPVQDLELPESGDSLK